jgi:hypothetical protein
MDSHAFIFSPSKPRCWGHQNNHEWSAMLGRVRTHGLVPDNRPKSRYVAISLRPSVSTKGANRVSRPYATSVFLASDLSLNVDPFFFSSTPSMRPGNDAQQRQEQRSSRYCISVDILVLSAQPSYPTPCPSWRPGTSKGKLGLANSKYG